ncbi:hypothetical protein TWF694_011780 [Orbilia ellipsospora]|uniref:MYND-type domain-containing protein n=1 Tax=Orbilia ellipsospora TaxID=2528407 RepID=A0AAV9X7F5_9PEZI
MSPKTPLIPKPVAARMLRQNLTPQQATIQLLLDERHPSTPSQQLYTTTPPPTPSKCAVCETPTSFSCTSCHGIHYCCSAHELQDRANHKFICPAVSSIPLPPPVPSSSDPQGHNIAVLVFPEFSAQPYYQWTEWKKNKYGKPVFDLAPFFGVETVERGGVTPMWVLHHPVTRVQLDMPVMGFKLKFNNDSRSHAYYKPDSNYNSSCGGIIGSGDGREGVSSINLCAYNASKGRIDVRRYRGTMVFFNVGREIEEDGISIREWFASLRPEDVYVIVEHLKVSAPVNCTPDSATIQNNATMLRLTKDGEYKERGRLADGKDLNGSVKGVAVSITNNTLKLEQLEIPNTHPVFDIEDPRVHEPTFAEAYCFPIRTFMYSTRSSSSTASPAKTETGTATTLKSFIRRLFPTVEIVLPQPSQHSPKPEPETDEKDTDPGYPTIRPSEWDEHGNDINITAVLIARGGKDVEVAHVKAFAEFCGYLESIWKRYDEFRRGRRREWDTETNGESLGGEWELRDVVVIDLMYAVLERDAFKTFWEERYAKDEGQGMGPFEAVRDC